MGATEAAGSKLNEVAAGIHEVRLPVPWEEEIVNCWRYFDPGGQHDTVHWPDLILPFAVLLSVCVILHVFVALVLPLVLLVGPGTADDNEHLVQQHRAIARGEPEMSSTEATLEPSNSISIDAPGLSPWAIPPAPSS